MWRAFFMAIGIFTVILGLEFLIVEKMVMADGSKQGPTVDLPSNAGMNIGMRNNDFKPGEGLPWLLLSAGTVVIIYTFTIPKRAAAQTHPS